MTVTTTDEKGGRNFPLSTMEFVMNKRDFLKGFLAATFVAAVPFKAMAKLTTSASPPLTKEYHRYDSVAMAYVTQVLNRTPPASRLGMKTTDTYRLIKNYADLVPPDPVKADLFLEHDKEARKYFASLPKADRYNY